MKYIKNFEDFLSEGFFQRKRKPEDEDRTIRKNWKLAYGYFKNIGDKNSARSIINLVTDQVDNAAKPVDVDKFKKIIKDLLNPRENSNYDISVINKTKETLRKNPHFWDKEIINHIAREARWGLDEQDYLKILNLKES